MARNFTFVLIGVVVAVSLGVVFSIPAWLLWNWVMPALGLPTLSFFQMLALETLLRLLIPTTTVKER